MKKKYFKAAAAAFILIIIVGCVLVSTKGLAQAKGESSVTFTGLKCYKSIEICRGDSLWSIASKNLPEEYSGINAYIADIKRINGLKDDRIYEGTYLVIPYYK